MSYPAVRQWLLSHTSLEPALLEGAGFDAHVGERLAASRSANESAYISALEQSSDEIDCLTSGIAVPETWFFRYPQSFRLLVEFLEQRRSTGATGVRMASIGCATGEEPHSMAMAALHAGWPAVSIDIEAFDRSARALARARSAVYGAASFRGEIPAWAADDLLRTGAQVVVDPAISRISRFVEMDVTQPGVFLTGAPRDIIFCRNLLIYLDANARRRLLEQCADSLAPGGLLFVGHAEPLVCVGPLFRQCVAPHAFVLERTGVNTNATVTPPSAARITSHPTVERLASPMALRPSPPPIPPRAHVPHEPTIDDARDLADAGRSSESEAMVRSLVSRHGPSADAMELLGMIRMAARDHAEAKRCFEQAVYLEPTRTASLIQLAMISESRGDTSRAETYWRRVRRSDAPNQQEQRG